MDFGEVVSSKQPRRNRPHKGGESFGKKQKSGKRSATRRVVLGSLLACLIVLVMIGGRSAVRALNEWTVIQQLTVVGLDRLSREEIMTKLHLSQDSSLWSIDIDHLSDQLEAHPWIRSVTFDRVLPHTLVIEVEERRPAALLRASKQSYLLDAEGYLLPGEVTKASQSLPVLEGMTSNFFSKQKDESHRRAKQGIHLAEKLGEHFSGRPEVNVSHAHTTIVNFPRIRVQFGQEPQRQWERFLVLYPTLKDSIDRRPQEVDLRFSQKVILRERTL